MPQWNTWRNDHFLSMGQQETESSVEAFEWEITPLEDGQDLENKQ